MTTFWNLFKIQRYRIFKNWKIALSGISLKCWKLMKSKSSAPAFWTSWSTIYLILLSWAKADLGSITVLSILSKHLTMYSTFRNTKLRSLVLTSSWSMKTLSSFSGIRRRSSCSWTMSLQYAPTSNDFSRYYLILPQMHLNLRLEVVKLSWRPSLFRIMKIWRLKTMKNYLKNSKRHSMELSRFR